MHTLMILLLLGSPAWAGKKKKELMRKKAAAREATFPALVHLRGEYGVRPPDQESREILESSCRFDPLACEALENPFSLSDTVWKEACEDGNQQACVVEGWRLAQLRPGVPSLRAPDPQAGSRLFYEACNEDVPEGCLSLGALYFYGVGVEQSPQRYHDLNKKACDLGHPVGCARHEARLSTAEAELESACPDNPMACSELARMHHLGINMERDRAAAIEYREKACLGGVLDDCVPVALTLAPKQSASELDSLCKRGSLFACAEYGKVLAEGKGVGEDIDEAGRLWKEGCDAFHAPSCVALGRATVDGRVEGGREAGVQYFKDACDRGEQVGCIALAENLRTGTGIERDLSWASALYEEACQAGHDLACTELGIMYRYGEGFPHDYKRARELMEQACEGGDGYGCVQRAEIPAFADEDIAEWLRQGCEKGSPIGCRRLANNQLNARQIDKALANLDRACHQLYDRASCGRYTVVLASPAAGENQDVETAAITYAETCALYGRDACWAVEGHFDELSADTLEQPIETLRQACADRNPAACLSVGDFLRAAERYDEALAQYKKKCEQGILYGCLQTADMAIEGDGGEPNIDAARSILKATCESAPDEGCKAFSDFAEEHGNRADKRWLAEFRKKQKEEDDGKGD